MSEKRMFRLVHREARANCIDFVSRAPDGYVVTVKAPTRSLDQNAKLWCLLGELSDQVNWHGQRLEPAEWKDVMTAALKRQKVVPGVDGGFVVLGSSTSRMSKQEMSELLEMIQAFGAQHNVKFNDAEAEATA